MNPTHPLRDPPPWPRPWAAIAELLAALLIALMAALVLVLWPLPAQAQAQTRAQTQAPTRDKPLCASLPRAEQAPARAAGLCTDPQLSISKAAIARPPVGCPPVPDFVAQRSSYAQAVAQLARQQAQLGQRLPAFRVLAATTRPSSAPAQTILEQSIRRPADSAQCLVSFVVSDASLVRVPSLAGMAREQAQRSLLAAQLQPEFSLAMSDSAPGLVLRQSPNPFVEVPRNSTVTVVIAQTPVFTIPAVIGLDQAAATQRLSPWRVLAQPTPGTQRGGVVIAQAPAAGQALRKGEEVQLNVSDGSLVEVPAVTGASLAAAQAQLARAKLTTQRHAVEADAAPGTVVAQAPRAGSIAQRGSRVELQVAIGQTVPDVVGQTEAHARQMLRHFNIAVDAVEDERAAGQVLAQSIAPGSHVAAGSALRLRTSDGSIVTVPGVQGLALPQAKAELQRAGGLRAALPPERDRAGATVLTQGLAAGSKVKRGSSVALTVELPTPWWWWAAGGSAALVLAGLLLGWMRRPAHAAAAGTATAAASEGLVLAMGATGATGATGAAAAAPSPSAARPPPTPAIDLRASIELNSAVLQARQGQVNLPTVSFHAELRRGTVMAEGEAAAPNKASEPTP